MHIIWYNHGRHLWIKCFARDWSIDLLSKFYYQNSCNAFSKKVIKIQTLFLSAGELVILAEISKLYNYCSRKFKKPETATRKPEKVTIMDTRCILSIQHTMHFINVESTHERKTRPIFEHWSERRYCKNSLIPRSWTSIGADWWRRRQRSVHSELHSCRSSRVYGSPHAFR